jgi:hypothetical protein
MKMVRGLCLVLLGLTAPAREPAGWTLVRAPHFEIYSNASEDTARSLAGDFERLHSFFARQLGVTPPGARPVRVVAFAGAAEFDHYRPRPGASAFYVGGPDRDYIVMPAGARGDLHLAAHEYAHLLLRATGWTLPDWIAEGVSEVASTVHIGQRDSRAGGDIQPHSALLRTRWMPLRDLFAFQLRAARPDSEREEVFYAQSWAVADLLALSPRYSARFPALMASLASGATAAQALAGTYHTTPEALESELRFWLRHPRAPRPLPGAPAAPALRGQSLDGFAARALLADLRFASGELAQAEALFRALAQERPRDAAVQAALGAIAVQRGDTGAAVAYWKRAVDEGIADASLCYRYAVMASSRGVPDGQIRPALERALALDRDLDDARFRLALIDKNAGREEAAVTQLRAMREPAAAQAFVYWTTLADALLTLNRRPEARQAIARAAAAAADGEQRRRAEELAWYADSELTVQMDGNQSRFVRVPLGGPPRNPFIEPGDRAQTMEATLEHVGCEEAGLTLRVQTAHGPLTLSVPDVSRVQIRNAGGTAFEFVCGPQEPRKVAVDYTSSGILRGLELR